eukprot:8418866-Ditylum_brightwellii.AAC.1
MIELDDSFPTLVGLSSNFTLVLTNELLFWEQELRKKSSSSSWIVKVLTTVLDSSGICIGLGAAVQKKILEIQRRNVTDLWN